MDYKSIDIDVANVKALNDQTHEFEGYASVFGGVDSYNDSIVPGAYTKTLIDRKRPVQMYKNHSQSIVIGKYTDIHQDDTGLFVKGELTPGHSIAEDTYASLKHGAISGLSIGYRVVDSEQKDEINYLKEIDLVEISIVNNPADLNAQVSGVKQFEELLSDIEGVRDLEKFFRFQFDLSQKQSKSLITRIKASLNHRDDDLDETEQRDVDSKTKTSIENQLLDAIKNLKV